MSLFRKLLIAALAVAFLGSNAALAFSDTDAKKMGLQPITSKDDAAADRFIKYAAKQLVGLDYRKLKDKRKQIGKIVTPEYLTAYDKIMTGNGKAENSPMKRIVDQRIVNTVEKVGDIYENRKTYDVSRP